jgi:hypothetical protein
VVKLQTFIILAQDGGGQLHVSGKNHSIHWTDNCVGPVCLHGVLTVRLLCHTYDIVITAKDKTTGMKL